MLFGSACASLTDRASGMPRAEGTAEPTAAPQGGSSLSVATPTIPGTTTESPATATASPAIVTPEPTDPAPPTETAPPATPTRTPTLAPTPQPTATPLAPTIAPPTSTPAPDPLLITAFCNYGPTTEAACSSQGAAGLYASEGWDMWATVLDWDEVLFQLGPVAYFQEEFGEAFAALSPGTYSLRLHEIRDEVVTVSEPLWFTVLAPANPYREECASYMEALREARAAGAAAHYIAFVESQVARYCN